MIRSVVMVAIEFFPSMTFYLRDVATRLSLRDTPSCTCHVRIFSLKQNLHTAPYERVNTSTNKFQHPRLLTFNTPHIDSAAASLSSPR
jgi:hypothetical protein